MAVISRGQILRKGDPAEAINDLRGKIWKKSIAKDEIDAYSDRLNVISTRLQAGSRVIHVQADNQPDDSFVSVEPDLEDVYFTTMLGAGRSVDGEEAVQIADSAS
jgi:hypothetical protein